jgi:hypothetical protein
MKETERNDQIPEPGVINQKWNEDINSLSHQESSEIFASESVPQI